VHAASHRALIAAGKPTSSVFRTAKRPGNDLLGRLFFFYENSLRYRVGVLIASRSTEIPACWIVCNRVRFVVSAAMSASIIEEIEAVRFDAVICNTFEVASST